MSLPGVGALGGLAGIAAAGLIMQATGATAVLSDAGYAFLGVVTSAVIGATATITVAVISLKARDRDRDLDDPAELRRKADRIDKRQRRNR